MRPRRLYHAHTATLADKRARAARLIGFCTPERRAELTAEDVARHSGLPVSECAAMLAKGVRG